MQALQAVMLVVRVGILRSARLLLRTVVEVAAMGKGLLLRVLAVVAEASVQRGRQQAQAEQTALAAAAVVALLLVSIL